MIYLESGTMQLVNGFLARHPQHELELRILPDHRRKVHLHCHNGESWMGWRAECHRNELNRVVRELLDCEIVSGT